MRTDGSAENIRGNLTSLLIAISVTAGVFLVLLKNGVPVGLIVTELMISLSLLVVMRYGLRRANERWTGKLLSIVIPVVVAIPFGVEIVSRAIFLEGLPLEATAICALRNLTFLPFLFPKDQRCQCAGVAVSLLSVLSIYLQDHGVATSVIVFIYSVLSICWLIGWHWMKFHLKAPSHSQRQIPRSAKIGVVGLTLACALFGMLSLRATTTTTAIAGFMPSSGGSRWSDPFAFGGVGDGDQMVEATDSAKSIGPIESDLFLESKMPSIYDVFNDLYQEPAGKPKKMTRAIPLAPNDVTSNHNRLAKNEVASREFSATRRKSRRKESGKMDDVTSKALFYLKGRVPVHLKHEVYNSWDGTTLSFRGNSHRPELTLVEEQRTWVSCGDPPDSTAQDDSETHVVRIARLSTRRVPVPMDCYAVCLDKLHTAKFFQWTQDGVLSLAGGEIPRMTVLHVRSIPPRREVVQAVRLLRDEPPIDSGLDPAVVQKLQTWTAEARTDWDYVTSVVAGIQETCRFDPLASIDETESDVVNEFLLEEKCGPSYLFAIATARLLRENGFRTHVVSGFYARPKNYDRASGQTAVCPEDVHFWVEVQAHDESWITIEPSPGYDVQYARLSQLERLGRFWRESWVMLWSHKFILLFGVSCSVVVAIYRRHIYVYLLYCFWILPLPRTERALVRSSLTVLDAHACLRGCQRPIGITVEEWLCTVIEDARGNRIPVAAEFRRLVQWALYAGPEHGPTSSNPRQICHAFLESVLPRRRPRST
ncbi:MAG: transglutaminase domain-containing protein [Planctomycetaceae bacterium]|nr:transglutaminase domain-containing protein [Planctomycetaceae bacterium]